MRARQSERHYAECQTNEYNWCGPPEVCDRVEGYAGITLYNLATEEEWRLDMPRLRHAKRLMGDGAQAGKRMNPHGGPEQHKDEQPGTSPEQHRPRRGSNVLWSELSALPQSLSQI